LSTVDLIVRNCLLLRGAEWCCFLISSHTWILYQYSRLHLHCSKSYIYICSADITELEMPLWIRVVVFLIVSVLLVVVITIITGYLFGMILQETDSAPWRSNHGCSNNAHSRDCRPSNCRQRWNRGSKAHSTRISRSCIKEILGEVHDALSPMRDRHIQDFRLQSYDM